jgi:hypothetical protein
VQTGISRQQLSHIFKRCQSVAGDGMIFGYRALIPYSRIDAYKRTAPVTHVIGDVGAGCSGALSLLFERFPELEDFIVEKYLGKPKSKNDEARISAVRLHAKILTWLTEHGVTEHEWPFNTKTEGAETFRRYCKDLISTHEGRWLAARSGANAVMRSRIGKGIPPLFIPAKPFTCVQLDFHKIDAASIITITNSYGIDIDVPLARWHIGALIDENSTAVLGAIIALEQTPSSDSVLETVECALVPILDRATSIPLAIGLGSKIFPNQLMPELAGQGFSIIKMDNGWSNIATCVIENLVEIMGCAVDLGPVREWWVRHGIERLFGKMTRAGAQAAPTTYGSSPVDTVRNEPTETAKILKVRLSDIVHSLEQVILSHNSNRSEDLQMSSPIQVIQTAIKNWDSWYIPAYIPKPSYGPSELPLICYKTVVARIRGNAKKAERPYVKIGRWRFTNPRISSDFHLIGSHIKAYCSLRDARVVYGTLCSSGEILGKLNPPTRYADAAITFRMRAIIFRDGSNMRRKEKRASEAIGWSGVIPESKAPTPAEALRKTNTEVTRPIAVSNKIPQPSIALSFRKGGLFNLDMPGQVTKRK